MRKRRLCVGDIHGNFLGLLAALEAANYNKERDHLYFLGDLVDGHSQSKEVLDFILTIPKENRTLILGNHDKWFLDFLLGDQIQAQSNWYTQGGKATLNSYGTTLKSISSSGETYKMNVGVYPEEHVQLLVEARPFTTLTHRFSLFPIALTHGGLHLQGDDWQDETGYYWDRHMWSTALYQGRENYPKGNISKVFKAFSKIFIGHSTVHSNTHNPEAKPIQALNVWNLDTGGGWFGKITVMDIDTEEYFQSDFSKEYYPDFKGR